MYKSKRRFRVLSIVLLLLMLMSLFSACGKAGQEGSSGAGAGAGESSGQSEGGTETKTEPNFYDFAPKFEKQEIYNKDGVTVWIEPEDNAQAHKGFGADPVLRFITKNDSSKKVWVSCLELVTEDGFKIPVFDRVLYTEPGNEDTNQLFFMGNYCSRPIYGDYIIYQELGFGGRLGDFKLKCVVIEAGTNEHLDKFETAMIKTENSGTKTNIDGIASKPLIIDRDGIKLYYIDTVYLPMDQEVDKTDDIYLVRMFAVNDTDNKVSFYYRNELWNGTEQRGITLFPDEGLLAHGKMFVTFYLGKDDFTEAGIEKPENLKFDIIVRDGDFNDLFTQEGVLIEFPNEVPKLWEPGTRER